MTAGRLLAICAARVFLFATFMTVAGAIPLLTREWELSATAAVAIVSSFTLCYAVSVFGFGWVADHVGADARRPGGWRIAARRRRGRGCRRRS